MEQLALEVNPQDSKYYMSNQSVIRTNIEKEMEYSCFTELEDIENRRKTIFVNEIKAMGDTQLEPRFARSSTKKILE